MNLERSAMRGQLAELAEKRKKLRLRIEGNCQAVRTVLNTAMVVLVDNLDIPMAAEQMDELQEAWADLAVVNSQIERLEKELG
jgi:hypothetical protein